VTVSREERGEDCGEEDSDEWDRVVSGKERRVGTGSGFFLPGLRAGSSAGPERCPWPLSYFYFIFFLFFFYFSYFLHSFCIMHPNKVKPIS
jgi:hypothetical protein